MKLFLFVSITAKHGYPASFQYKIVYSKHKRNTKRTHRHYSLLVQRVNRIRQSPRFILSYNESVVTQIITVLVSPWYLVRNTPHTWHGASLFIDCFKLLRVIFVNHSSLQWVCVVRKRGQQLLAGRDFLSLEDLSHVDAMFSAAKMINIICSVNSAEERLCIDWGQLF